jgi:N-acetylmuramic acid 6-phosphate etherase
MAGGDGAIRKAVEFAEDDEQQGIKDLLQFNVSPKDFVVGITASGRTPYVLSALQSCKEMGILTGGIACNDNSSLKNVADYTVEVVTGPEFVTGSTRMKAGTATKMVLNMITTSVMIKLGHVKGNKMVDMQLTNLKLIDRGTKMVMEETGLDYETAKMVLLKEGSVRNAVDKIQGW